MNRRQEPMSCKLARHSRLVLFLGLLIFVFAPSVLMAQGAVGALRKLLESGRVPAERQGTIIEMICTRGEADDLAFVFQMLDKPGALTPDVKRKVVDLLTDAAVTRKVKPSGDLSPLAKLIEGAEAAKDRRLQVAAIRLAAAWKLTAVADTLRRLATSDKVNESLQQAALDGLVTIGGPESRKTIEELARTGRSTRIRVLAIAGLARIDVAGAAAAAVDVLSKIGPQDDVGPMLDALLSRKEGADALAKALESKPIPPDAAKIALRYIYSIGRSDQALSDVLSKAAGIALDAPPPSQEEVAKIAATVTAKGDPVRGEKIFRRADLSCMKCHSVSQAGGTVGPDLSPVGSISPVDYVVNSILNPNLAIKEQFVTRRILTVDGEVFNGIQIDRDEQRVRLRDAAGKVVTIPVANIDQEGEGKSLMPQGLTKFLTAQEFLDLAKFISELGKPGQYAIRKTPSIQRWRVLKTPGPELTGDVPNVEILREYVLDTPADAWSTAYGMVGGTLPLAELAPTRPALVYLQGEINVNQAGPIAIDIHSTEPAHVWLDAEPFERTKRVERALTNGKHTLTLRVEVSNRTEPELKVEITRPDGSKAQFVVVNGM
jgi:putative heme-binding domain-containing protein